MLRWLWTWFSTTSEVESDEISAAELVFKNPYLRQHILSFIQKEITKPGRYKLLQDVQGLIFKSTEIILDLNGKNLLDDNGNVIGLNDLTDYVRKHTPFSGNKYIIIMDESRLLEFEYEIIKRYSRDIGTIRYKLGNYMTLDLYP